MDKVDIKETLKFVRIVIVGLFLGSICAFLIGGAIGLIFRFLFSAPRFECPICNEQCSYFYERIDTQEILGCSYCIAKTNIYNEK